MNFIVGGSVSASLLCLFFFAGLSLYHRIKLKNPPYWTTKDYFEKAMTLHNKSFVLKIGRIARPNEKKLLFLNFPQKKSPGAIRVGTFGDSYTYGDEVSDGHDYPSFLQKIFAEKFPKKKIEVLNFSLSGYSFQQSFMLYEEYAEKYGIDYILLGPGGFYPDRGSDFCKNWGSERSPVKSRYILGPDQNSLKLIHINGRTPLEKYKNYYALVPSWKQMKYDRTPFQSLDDYFPFLKDLSSPFYHVDLSVPEESSQINKILLRKILLKHAGKVLFLTNRYIDTFEAKENGYEFYNLYKEVSQINPNHLGNLLFAKPLYERYCCHHSSLGNEIWSLMYFHALTGVENFFIDLINCNQVSSSKRKTAYIKQKFFLKDIKNIFLFSKGFKIGEFVMNNFSATDTRGRGVKILKKTKSFIGFFNVKDFFTHIPFYPSALSN